MKTTKSREKGQAKVLNDKELKILRSVAGNSKYGKRNICIIDFSFLLGLRCKEICSIKFDDVVEYDTGKIKDSFHLDKSQTKGNKGRAIYLSNKGLRKRLQDYIDSGVWIQGEVLFKTQKGTFTSQSLQNLFRKLYRDCGFDSCSSHSGRRTFCTNLVKKGFDLKHIQVLMGHSSVNMTARYVQENPQMLCEMVSEL